MFLDKNHRWRIDKTEKLYCLSYDFKGTNTIWHHIKTAKNINTIKKCYYALTGELITNCQVK